KPGAQRLSLAAERSGGGGPLLRARRRAPAGGPGVDGLQIPARSGDAGLQPLLASPAARPAPHGRLPRRLAPLPPRHRPDPARTRPGRRARLACQIASVAGSPSARRATRVGLLACHPPEAIGIERQPQIPAAARAGHVPIAAVIAPS